MQQSYPNIQNHLITCAPGEPGPVFTQARGITVTDETGREFRVINDISCALGYAHPRFTRELARLVQTKMLCHPGNYSPEKETLIANFMEVTRGDFDKIFFAASGGEVVDWSLKAARRATGRDGIISFNNALHGRSFAGAYISGTPSRKEGFGTGLQNIHFWVFPGDGRAFEPEADRFTDIAAVIIEPYQALGGMVSPTKEYWQWLRRWTKERGILLILDEIQTGFGKTGSFFAYTESGIVPDMLLAGKGMSNGFGLGALLMSKEVGSAIRYYEMSGGSADNDLMCSIVNLVFDIYREENIPEHARQVGGLIRAELEKMLEELGIPGRIHGAGLFMSLELPEGLAAKIAGDREEHGFLFGRSGNKLMFRPPLVITETEAREMCAAIRKSLEEKG